MAEKYNYDRKTMTYVDASAALSCFSGFGICAAVGCSFDLEACGAVGCSSGLGMCFAMGCSFGLEMCAIDSSADLRPCAAVGVSAGLDTASGLVMFVAFGIAGLTAFSLRIFASLRAAAGLDILVQRPKRSLQRDLSMASENWSVEW